MDAQANARESRGGVLGAVVTAASYAAATVALLWSKATQDGHLAAAGRQGIDELGTALKAFPDAIQSQEPGTIFNPTQGEVAASRRDFYRTPGQLDHGHGVYGERHGQTSPEIHAPSHRSPSEIAADKTPFTPEQQHGQDQSHGL